MLIALNECSEWGRITILGALSRYVAQDDKESEHICERVVPQFQHANASVVLAAMKVRRTHSRSHTCPSRFMLCAARRSS